MTICINRLTVAFLISAAGIFSSFATLAETSNTTRVATEDLVEGIKSRDGRWFEVEVIIFERKDNQGFREIFNQPVSNLDKPRKWDLIRSQLQPDISLFLNKLEECHSNRNPLLNTLPEQQLPADEFYQAMQAHQKLISHRWQFTNELCLLPDESLSGYWHFDNQLTALSEQELQHVPLDAIPEKVTAGDHDDLHNVYLLADQNLQLKEEFFTLKKHRDFTPLLHVGWRQPGLTKRRSIPVYLLAGKNYSEQYQYDGTERLKIENPLPLDDNIEQSDKPEDYINQEVNNNLALFIQKLQSGAKVDFETNQLIYPDKKQMPEHSWQLDGFIQIHLNHYLFIDSQFNYRQPMSKFVDPEQLLATNLPFASENESNSVNNSLNDGENSPQPLNSAPQQDSSYQVNYLQNYELKQNLRVYSGDIHYLDHPKFGVLIQIRKYRH